MFFDVTDADYVQGYRIKLGFEDGSSGIADLAEYSDQGGVFSAFQNQDYFRRFTVEHGVLVWGEGEVDIAPERLYELATGKPVTYGAVERSDA